MTVISRIVFLGAILAVVGCASVPDAEVKKQDVVLDDGCARLAKYVRAVALARDVGIPKDDAKIVVRGEQPFSIEPVINDVYSTPQKDPVTSAVTSYNVCVERGFDNMVVLLEKAHAQNEQRKTEDFRKMASELQTSSVTDNLKLKMDITLSAPKKRVGKGK